MKAWWVATVAAYLLIATAASCSAVYSLWSLRCADNSPCPAREQPATESSKAPAQPAAGTTQAPTPPGTGPAQPQTPAATGTAQTQTAPAAGETQPQTASAPAASGQRTEASQVYKWTWAGIDLGQISQDAQFLLLVIFMGAFGSSVYALKSLADYQGESKLYTSWLTYFVIQPFEGSGIAMLMYLVIRGGFLSGSDSAVGTVNKFGICAIAGLTGAFSDTAFMKLREVFQTLFKPQDDRGGKVDDLAISTESLPDGVVNQAYTPVLLAAQNGVTPLTWTVTPDLPPGLSLSATGTISGTPTAASPKTNYTFKVTDSSTPQSSATKVLTLTVS